MENNWKSFLGDYLNTGLYYLPVSGAEEDKIIEAARDHELKAVIVNMNRVSRKQTFLSRFARALQFPVYFGQNWDALFDSLTDLSWTKAPGHVILIYNLKDMAKKSPEDMRVIRRVFEAAAEYWQSRQMLFFILISEKPCRRIRLPHDR